MDFISFALDVVWFSLFYNYCRVLMEAFVTEFLKKEGGTKWERKVSSFDIPCAFIVSVVYIVNRTKRVACAIPSRIFLYAVLVIIVSLYRAFVKPYINSHLGR